MGKIKINQTVYVCFYVGLLALFLVSCKYDNRTAADETSEEFNSLDPI